MGTLDGAIETVERESIVVYDERDVSQRSRKGS